MSQFHVVWCNEDSYETKEFTSQRKVDMFIKEQGIVEYTVIKGNHLGDFIIEDEDEDEDE